MGKQKPNPVACQICGRVIKRASDMARHQLTHAENKEAKMHRCQFYGCNYKTLQVCNLRTHGRTHTGQRPLECPIPGCDFRTAHAKSLSRHQQKKHPDVPNENSESLHQPADSRSTTRREYRFVPYPQQVGKRSKHAQVEDGHLATTSRADHALLASGSGTSTASRVTAAEPQPSYRPFPKQADFQTHVAAALADSKGSFDDLDSLFNEWLPDIFPLNGSPPPPLPLVQRSISDVSNTIATSSSISLALGSVNDSSLPSIYSSPVSYDAPVRGSPSLPLPLVQYPVVNTKPLQPSSTSPALSSVNSSLPLPPPVWSFESIGVPMPAPSLSPSYELQYSTEHQPASTHPSWVLPAHEAQCPPSIYGYNDCTTAESLLAAQSAFPQPSLFATPDMSVPQSQAARPRAFVGIDHRYLGQSHIYATGPATTVTNTTNYGGVSTSGGSGMQGLYTW